MSTLTPAGRTIRTNLVTGAVAVALVVVALIVIALFGDDEAVDGPDGSSFVTTPQGTAALYETLAASGREVGRHRSPIDRAALSGVGAVIASDVGSATYDPLEIEAMAAFVEAGGRLVVAGRPNSDLVSALVGEPPTWSPSTTVNGERTIGEGVVIGGRFGIFESTTGIPLVVSGENPLATAHPIGDGLVVLVADSAILSNATLDRAANAHFALSIVGDGPVLFDEFRHGFTDAGRTGLLAAAPDGWRVAGILAVPALVAALVVYGRRFGPAEPEARQLAPGRDRLIVAVGSTLRRTGRHVEATESVRREVIRRVTERSMLSPDAGDQELRAAAAALLPPEEIDAVFAPTADTVLIADRALARLGPGEGEAT